MQNSKNSQQNNSIIEQRISTASVLLAICQNYGLEAAFAYLHRCLSAFGTVLRLNCSLSARNDPVSLTFFEIPRPVDIQKVKVRTPLLPRERQELLYNASATFPYIVSDLGQDEQFMHVSSYESGGLLLFPLVKSGKMAVFFSVQVEDGRILHRDFIECAGQARVLAEAARNLLLKGYTEETTGKGATSMDMLRQCVCMADMVRVVEKLAELKELVLITGETGSGKDVVARALHESSPRARGAFVRVNCGGIPDSLVDTAFFGHEQGAFTDAKQSRAGYVEQAHQGTLFLDEVGELSPTAQTRLLRILERQEVQRVGGRDMLMFDVRVIAATHRDLWGMVEEGTFRKDLWFRLNVFPLRIPSLRERKADIPFLVRRFLKAKAAALGLAQAPPVEENALYALYDYDWPGNVRELEHFVGRALVRFILDDDGGPLFFPSPGADTFDAVPQRQEWPTLEQMEQTYIRQVVEHCCGRIAGHNGAAAMLGLNPSTLRSRMVRLGVAVPSKKKE